MYIAIIVCCLIGILTIFLGYLIWKKKKLNFIAGFSEEAYKGDKEKLAKAVGLFSIVVGILVIFFPFSLQYIGEFTGIIFTVLITFGTIGLIIYINVIKK